MLWCRSTRAHSLHCIRVCGFRGASEGRATAHDVHVSLMSPMYRKLLGTCAAACNVVRARKPLLLCMCQCSAVKMGSSGRDAPPGTHIPRYGAREVVKIEYFFIVVRLANFRPFVARACSRFCSCSLGLQAATRNATKCRIPFIRSPSHVIAECSLLAHHISMPASVHCAGCAQFLACARAVCNVRIRRACRPSKLCVCQRASC